MDDSDLESNLSNESAEKGIILEGIVEIYLQTAIHVRVS